MFATSSFVTASSLPASAAQAPEARVQPATAKIVCTLRFMMRACFRQSGAAYLPGIYLIALISHTVQLYSI